MTAIDIFVWVSGSISVLIAVPMVVLALWSGREARQLRIIQAELVGLMGESRQLGEELRALQHGLRVSQRVAHVEARQAAKDVSGAVEEIGVAVTELASAVELVGETVAADADPAATE